MSPSPCRRTCLCCWTHLVEGATRVMGGRVPARPSEVRTEYGVRRGGTRNYFLLDPWGDFGGAWWAARGPENSTHATSTTPANDQNSNWRPGSVTWLLAPRRKPLRPPAPKFQKAHPVRLKATRTPSTTRPDSRPCFRITAPPPSLLWPVGGSMSPSLM